MINEHTLKGTFFFIYASNTKLHVDYLAVSLYLNESRTPSQSV